MYLSKLTENIQQIIDSIIPRQKPVVLFQFQLIMARALIALEDKHYPRIDDIHIIRNTYQVIISGIIHYCEQHPTDLDCDYEHPYKTIQDIGMFLKEKEKSIFDTNSD